MARLKNTDIKTEKKIIKSYIKSQSLAGALNTQHPLQRESEQWSAEEKSNFIRRLCWHEPVPNLYIVEYKTEEGRTIRYLIDGKQRFTTILDFVNNQFAISKKTRNTNIVYEKTLYETETDKKGKQIYKLDESGNRIPIKDEDGNIKSDIVSFDIAGKRFKQFPEELQEKFMYYNLGADIRQNGTNEDIQNDILDYNSGKPMNNAQIGTNLLGVRWATEIHKLVDHDFFSDNCGFSLKDSKKGVIHSSIGEALMLIFFEDGWVSNAKQIGAYLGGHLEQSYIDEIDEMLTDLHDILPDDNETLRNKLKSPEFFMVMANYYHFLSLDYDKQTYGKFLQKWFEELVFVRSDEMSETEVLYNKEETPVSYDEFTSIFRSKATGNVRKRLNYMNAVMEHWLIENEEHESDETADDLYNIDDHEALIAAALCFELPDEVTNDFITEVKREMASATPKRIEEINADLVYFGDEAKKLMRENIDADGSSFDTPENTAALAKTLKAFYEEGLLKVVKGYIDAWLTEFSENWEIEDYADIKERDIIGKSSELYNQIIKEAE